MQKTMRQIAIYSLSTMFALLLFVGISIIYAWDEPTLAPPIGNVAAPVNVGGAPQYKSGALGVGGVFRGYGTGIFDGNVGIGTTGPANKLEIKSISGNNILQLTNNAIGDGNDNALIFKDSANEHGRLETVATQTTGPGADGVGLLLKSTISGRNLGFSTATGQNMRWYVGTSQKMHLDSNGNVGIGTTGPGSKLDVRGGDLRVNGAVAFTDSAGTPYTDNWIGRYNDGTVDWLHIGGITTSAVRRIGLWADRTYFSGNVGIGTTTPSAKLDIQTSNGSDAFKINTYKMVPISATELGVYDSNNNQVLIFDQGI